MNKTLALLMRKEECSHGLGRCHYVETDFDFTEFIISFQSDTGRRNDT